MRTMHIILGHRQIHVLMNFCFFMINYGILVWKYKFRENLEINSILDPFQGIWYLVYLLMLSLLLVMQK